MPDPGFQKVRPDFCSKPAVAYTKSQGPHSRLQGPPLALHHLLASLLLTLFCSSHSGLRVIPSTLEMLPPQGRCLKPPPQVICRVSPFPLSSLCSNAPPVRLSLNILIKMTIFPSPESPYPALYHLFSHSTHHLLTCYIYMLFLLLCLLTAYRDIYFVH